MRLGGASAVQIGMVVGFLAAGICGWGEIQRSGPVVGIFLMACLIIGAGSVYSWSFGLRGRCEAYERALKAHGIDPDRV